MVDYSVKSAKLNLMVEQQQVHLDRVFHALADPTRRGMLHHLATGERSIGALAAPFSMSFAAASKHVRVLETAGLLRRRRDGRQHLCSLDAQPLADAEAWLKVYERYWTARFDALDAALSRHGKSTASE